MDSEFPQEVLMPNPPGRIRWSPVTEGGVLVGAVWMAIQPTARPRAGIILAPEVDPSVRLQQELGEMTLRVRSSSTVSAFEFLDFLASTRIGLAGGLSVGTAREAASLDEVRSRLANIAATDPA